MSQRVNFPTPANVAVFRGGCVSWQGQADYYANQKQVWKICETKITACMRIVKFGQVSRMFVKGKLSRKPAEEGVAAVARKVGHLNARK